MAHPNTPASQTGNSSASAGEGYPSLDEARKEIQKVFGQRLCNWQYLVTKNLLQRKHVFASAATGMGKTLAFLASIAFRPGGTLVIVAPLNVLGNQMEELLTKAGISAISINGDTATEANYQNMRKGRFRVVIISPEQAMKERGGFQKLLGDAEFCARLIGIVFDEAHCISRWYTPLVFVSATLTTAAVEDIKRLFALPPDKIVEVRRPNDRPNVCVGIRQIKHPVESCLDLAFLVPQKWKAGDDPPAKFVAFFNSIAETVTAAKMLRARLPPAYRHKIVWFNSSCSDVFKAEQVERLKRGEIWGLCATDSFGLGVDLPNIILIIQYRISGLDIDTLWQRIGRAARNRLLQGTALVFVEKKYFDEVKEKKAKNKCHSFSS